MNAKRIIGFLLLFGAIYAFGNKLTAGMSATADAGIIYFFFFIIGLILLMGIRQVLRS